WSKWWLFLPGAITFGLGTWQIFRRQDKVNAMLEYRQKRLQTERLNGISSSLEKSESLEFRRVVCIGVFDEDRSRYVGPRSRSISGVIGNCYYLITPLIPVPNDLDHVQSTVLVNRGWVPRNWRDKPLEISHDSQQPADIASLSVQHREQSSWWRFWSRSPKLLRQVPAITPVEVVGVVRGSEKPSMFAPANDPSSRQWCYVDIPGIARALGLQEDTIYIEDINENVNPSTHPFPKDVNTLIHGSVMPQDHLNYTLTWYSLSTAVTFMAFRRLRPKKVGDSEPLM
ncbi:LOW QUALITY PROTEIN: SURF1 domain-containing protein, partial [Cephalotus follicularis]